MAQEGGTEWFTRHLKLNGFDPIVFDGRDPAAFAWAIFEMEHRLLAEAQAMAESGEACYNVSLPYGVACAPKGAGFYGEGTNLAHNLPSAANPHEDVIAAHNFNESARRLWVPTAELDEAIAAFQHHAASGRPRERDHALNNREVTLHELPPTLSRPVAEVRQDSSTWTRYSPMAAVDEMFLATVEANPHLRPRVGNPDEMRSNRMTDTLEALKFRVVCPEPGIPESHHGAVITALNEEAVANAALANTGGINLIVTYEAFAAKMHGAVRQEIIFANHLSEGGRPQHWLSVPLVLTSHAWENGKNEQSHQDTMMAEAMMNELSHVSRVLFPADYNTAAAAMSAVYQSQGQIWTMLVAKADTVANLFSTEEASQLIADGAMRLDWAGYRPDEAQLVLTALGAYQLEQALKASARLTERSIPHAVVICWSRAPSASRVAPVSRLTSLRNRCATRRGHHYPASRSKRVEPMSQPANQATIKLLIINPGSTSTKLALYQGARSLPSAEAYRDPAPLWSATARHSADQLAQFSHSADQFTMRDADITALLQQQDTQLTDLDVVVGRGGLFLHPIKSGTYLVTPAMLAEMRAGDPSGQWEHASNLGILLAQSVAEAAGRVQGRTIPTYTVDPPTVDEMQDIARVTGWPETPRRALAHVLSVKAAGRRASHDLGKPYAALNLVISHLGGGISITAHRQEQMIDENQALDGEGPFSPERSGGLPVGDLARICFSGQYSYAKIKHKIAGGGGLVAHLGTNDAQEVERRIAAGDEHARLIFRAMAYTIGKEVGRMAAALGSRPDALVFTGDLAHSAMLTSWLREQLAWLAPILIYPRSDEMLALARGAYRALLGIEQAQQYGG